MNLLDLMGAPVDPAPQPPTKPAAVPANLGKPYTARKIRPMWRNGATVPGSDVGYVPHFDGDLRWLVHCYVQGEPLGRWYRWHGKKAQWICIDPADATGINDYPDTPPNGSVGA
ncbi:hypothetical protein [Novosphingobium sp. SG707]|uniref:hypothetical protein n=1 Tax=Novosphingobium sp. SG707 TaxID=2586996 RepID=UPI0014465881|nr:hypothetical protein [Novosphingobium sp. SG707]NKI99625.1 hypothetical protein [Novosphingobium sp. SG707]